MSSEALEAKRLRENATRRNMMGLLMTCEPTDVLALLAEVARLEQARDAYRDRESQVNVERQRNEVRAELAEAALAVSREREQPTRQALAALLARHVALVESGDCGFWNVEEEPEVIAARAALVDEPAADKPQGYPRVADQDARPTSWASDSPAAATLAEPEQAERREHQRLDAPAKGTPPGSASAAADEPDHAYRPVRTIEGVVCGYCKGPATSPRHYPAADEPGETPCC